MIVIEDSVLKIAGAVDNRTAPALLTNAMKEIGQGVSVIDLSAVERVDSSAVSMLLHLQRSALESGRALHLQNIPANLQALIHLYDLDQALCPLSR